VVGEVHGGHATAPQFGQDFVVANGGLLEEAEQDFMLVPLLGGGHDCVVHTPLFAGDIGAALHTEACAGRDYFSATNAGGTSGHAIDGCGCSESKQEE